MKKMIWIAALLVGCGGTERSTCDHAAPVALADDESTPLGTAEDLLDQLDGASIELDDGSIGTLSVEQRDDATFVEAVPGVQRTGLPPYSHLLIAVECNSRLIVPIDYTITVDEVVYQGTGELIDDGMAQQLEGSELWVVSDGQGGYDGALAPSPYQD